MTIENFNILFNISIIAALVPIVFLIFPVKSTFVPLRKVLLILTIVWLLAEIGNEIITEYIGNNYLNIHLYDLVSTVLYLIYFKFIFSKEYERKALNILIVLYSIINILTIVLAEAYFKPVISNLFLTMLIPFILSLISFYKIAKISGVNNLLKEPNYWINSAILIRFGMSIVGILISDILYNNLDLFLYVWPFVIVSNIFYNLLLTVGIWKMRRT